MALRILTVDGVEWNVYDVRPDASARLRMGGASSDHLIAGWLAFEAPGEKRRLAPIPDGWDTYPDEELVDALTQAEPVAAAARRPASR